MDGANNKHEQVKLIASSSVHSLQVAAASSVVASKRVRHQQQQQNHNDDILVNLSCRYPRCCCLWRWWKLALLIVLCILKAHRQVIEDQSMTRRRPEPSWVELRISQALELQVNNSFWEVNRKLVHRNQRKWKLFLEKKNNSRNISKWSRI